MEDSNFLRDIGRVPTKERPGHFSGHRPPLYFYALLLVSGIIVFTDLLSGLAIVFAYPAAAYLCDLWERRREIDFRDHVIGLATWAVIGGLIVLAIDSLIGLTP